MIGTIEKLEMVKGCNWLTVRGDDGNSYEGCIGDTYPLVLVTYSSRADEIVGKRVSFVLKGEYIASVMSVEGYDAQSIYYALEHRSIVLDPLTAGYDNDPRVFDLWRAYEKTQRRKSDKRTKILTRLSTANHPYDPALVFFVVDHGALETAMAVWLGELPFRLDALRTDDEVVSAVRDLCQRGGIARQGATHIVGIEPPRLIQSQVATLALPAQ